MRQTMMYEYFFIICSTLISIISAQLFLQHPSFQQSLFHTQQRQQNYAPSFQPAASIAHRAVIENAAYEAQLPSELTNKFYKNPRIAEALAKESWFTDKEMPVFEREAEKIPREQVYKLFRDAGFLDKRQV